MSPFVTKLSQYLEAEGLSQTEFARLLGVAPPMVSGWCTATRRPDLGNALAIEKITRGRIKAAYWTTVEKTRPKTRTTA